jgi:hypothetical protein
MVWWWWWWGGSIRRVIWILILRHWRLVVVISEGCVSELQLRKFRLAGWRCERKETESLVLLSEHGNGE